VVAQQSYIPVPVPSGPARTLPETEKEKERRVERDAASPEVGEGADRASNSYGKTRWPRLITQDGQGGDKEEGQLGNPCCRAKTFR
jgi:hypothetical protein